MTVGSIKLAANRIRIELLEAEARNATGPSLWIDLEERRGVLVAGTFQPGWLDQLDEDPRRTLDEAVAGLFKMSGVGLVQTPGESSTARTNRTVTGRTERLVLSELEITWSDWVAAWEAEASGEMPLEGRPHVLPRPEAEAERRSGGRTADDARSSRGMSRRVRRPRLASGSFVSTSGAPSDALLGRGRSGSRMMNRVPWPGVESTSIVPPCSLTIP